MHSREPEKLRTAAYLWNQQKGKSSQSSCQLLIVALLTGFFFLFGLLVCTSDPVQVLLVLGLEAVPATTVVALGLDLIKYFSVIDTTASDGR